MNRVLLLTNFKKSQSVLRNRMTCKAFSTQCRVNSPISKVMSALGNQGNTGVKRGRPETFVGDLQEVLKIGPNNINAFFFSWSITCRVATALLCMLLI